MFVIELLDRLLQVITIAERGASLHVDAVRYAIKGVILHPLTDARPVNYHIDAVMIQQLSRSDSRHLQKLRRLENTRREDDLSGGRNHIWSGCIAGRYSDAGRPCPVENNLLGQGIVEDEEVRPTKERA